jgi:hypothetical protein
MDRTALCRGIATDIYRAAQRSPMTMTADGGELCALLAELALKRVEEAGWIQPERDSIGGSWVGYNDTELRCRDCSWAWNVAYYGWDRARALETLRGHRALNHSHKTAGEA